MLVVARDALLENLSLLAGQLRAVRFELEEGVSIHFLHLHNLYFILLGPSLRLNLLQGDWWTGLDLCLVFFKLQFETEVGADPTPLATDEVDGGFKGKVVLLHDVGDDEGGGLNKEGGTREMPAAQWTRTAPSSSLRSMVV